MEDLRGPCQFYCLLSMQQAHEYQYADLGASYEIVSSLH